MKLRHIQRRPAKNSFFRAVNDLNGKIYPLGLTEEIRYVEDLNIALNHKYSKVVIANMLRRIMSYVIITNSPISTTTPQAKKIVNTISENEMSIITNYIITNNQHIANLNSSNHKYP